MAVKKKRYDVKIFSDKLMNKTIDKMNLLGSNYVGDPLKFLLGRIVLTVVVFFVVPLICFVIFISSFMTKGVLNYKIYPGSGLNFSRLIVGYITLYSLVCVLAINNTPFHSPNIKSLTCLPRVVL